MPKIFKDLKLRMLAIVGVLVIIGFFAPTPGHPQQSEIRGGEQENRDFLYATKLMQNKMFDVAAEQLRQFIKDYPRSVKVAEAQFLLGEALFQAENFEEARKEFQKVVVKYPDSPKADDAQFKIGQCYRRLGDVTAGAKAFQRVQDFYPQSEFAPEGLFAAAELYEESGNLKKAQQCFRRIIYEHPESDWLFKARIRLAKVLRKDGNFDQAIKELQKVIRGTRKEAMLSAALFEQGRGYEEWGRIDKALKAYLRLLEVPGAEIETVSQANFRVGKIYQHELNWEKALEFFNKVISIATDEDTKADALMAVGDTYFLQSSYSQALKAYQKLTEELKKGQQHWLAVFKSAVCYERLADYRNAIRTYEKCIATTDSDAEISPLLELAYLRLIEAHLHLGDPQAALKYCRQWLAKFSAPSPRKQEIEYKIGEIYETQTKDYTSAIANYQAFMDKNPQSSLVDDAQLALGRCHERLGHYLLARKEYQRLLDNFPGSEYSDLATEKTLYLQTYYIKNPDSAVNKLVSLIGDLIADKPRGELSFELAKIYYEDFKDYQKAIDQFGSYLLVNPEGPESAEALFLIGKSYENLGKKADTAPARAYLDSAKAYYIRLIENFPQSQWVSAATINLVELKLNDLLGTEEKLNKTVEYYAELQKRFASSQQADLILLRLGDALSSSSAKDAYENYQQLLIKYPHSKYRAEASFKKGLCLLKMGNLTGAKREIAAYAKNFPNHKNIVQAHYLLATIAGESGDYQRAISEYELVMDRYFYSHYADSSRLKIGDLYFKSGDYNSALEHYESLRGEQLPGKFFEDPVLEIYRGYRQELDYKIGRCYEKLAKLDQAEKVYWQYLSRFPKGKFAQEVLFAVGEIEKKRGNFNRALTSFQRLRDNFPSGKYNFQTRMAIAELFLQNGDYDKAFLEYQNALPIAPSAGQRRDLEAKKILCLVKMGKIKRVDTELRAFKKKFKDSKDLLARIEYERGNYYLENKLFDRALRAYKKVLSKYKKTRFAAAAAFGVGKVYLITNQIEKALKILTVLPNKYPNSEILPLVYLSLGDFYYKSRQLDNAISAFKKVIQDEKAGTALPTAMKYLIKTYSDLGLWDAALAVTRDYIEKFPSAEDILQKKVQVGIFYVNLKEFQRAIEHFKDILPEADKETEPEIQYWIGKCYFNLGRYERAIAEFLKVRYLSQPTKLPWDVTAQYESGLAYMKLGEMEKAKNIFRQIIRERGASSDYGRVAQKKIDEIEEKQK